MCITTITTYNECTLSFACPTESNWRESEEFLKSEKFLDRVVLFIREYYPKLDFPIYMWSSSYYSISLSYGHEGGKYVNMEKEDFEQFIEEHPFAKLGIEVRVDLSDIAGSLTLIEYGIKQKKKLEKQYYKLRKKVDKGEDLTIEEDNSIEIEEEDLLPILSRPPSKKVANFLTKCNL